MAHQIAQLVTKDFVLQVPPEQVHFYSKDKSYLVIPLDLDLEGVELVRKEFGEWSSLDELNLNRKSLSEETIQVIDIINCLELENLLIEYVDDVGDSLPLFDFIQFIVKDGRVVKESTRSNVDENGYLLSEEILGYDLEEQLFYSYEGALQKYNDNK